MMLIKTLNLRYRFEGQTDNLFENINCEIDKHSKIGLIGENGCGKTTFLRLLTNELVPDAGQIIQKRDGITFGVLTQEIISESQLNIIDEIKSVLNEIYELKEKLERYEKALTINSTNTELLSEYGKLQEKFEKSGGYTIENRIETVLTGLGFVERDWTLPYSILSSGQKSRVELAKLLISQPDILFLDEPTNHLDIPALEWLETFLIKYSNAFLVISHDRFFLDQVVNKIWEIKNRHLNSFSGNYSHYVYERDLKQQQELDEFERKSKEVKRLKRAIKIQSTKANRVASKPRNLSNYDPKAKAFYGAKGAKVERRASVLKQRIEKIGEIEKPHIDQERHIDFKIDVPGSQFVCTAQHISKAYHEKVLFHDLNFSIRSGQRIALLGPNGCGKTTLLKIILGQEKADSGEILLGHNLTIGYSSQELTHLIHANSILNEVMSSAQEDQTWVRTVLGCIKIEQDKVHQPIHSLSPGERNKVSIAKILLSHANFLILDEPTNHLDIRTREIFESALEDYPGTVLFVSHDRRFIENIAQEVWNFWE
ncbi:ABC-F type ribosomal protection protein [candidate division KSB1 bacterium]|nr:ABC-F type ribosomal protection protein [candidate division KSB1 bacterium]